MPVFLELDKKGLQYLPFIWFVNESRDDRFIGDVNEIEIGYAGYYSICIGIE